MKGVSSYLHTGPVSKKVLKRLVGAAFIALVGSPGLAAADLILPPEYFGLHIQKLIVPFWSGNRGNSQWPNIKFGSWRIWASYTQWINLEPRKGQWNFSVLDAYINLAEKHKTDVVINLGRTPQWASERPEERCSADIPMGCAAPPRSLQDWENYVRTVVTRYKGRVKYYEVWNEPKFRDLENPYTGNGGTATYFSGTQQQLIDLLSVAYRTIKKIDPSAKVISPPMDGEDYGLKRLDRFLSAGGRDFFDVLGFHFYLQSAVEPEALPTLITKVKALMAKHGLEKRELWNTESGYLIQTPGLTNKPLDKRGTFSRVLSEAESPGYVSRSLILGAAYGLNRFYYFGWDGGTMSLTANNGTAPTAAAKAYSQTARWLTGSVVGKCENRGTLWMCPLRREGRSSWVVWNAKDPSQWTPAPDLKLAYLETLSGEAGRVGDKIFVGPTPILLKQEALPWSD